MSTHTPGPWEQWVGHGEIAANVTENKRHALTGTVVAVLPDAEDWEYDHDPEEWEANARLIAAAPELLAALKRVGCQDAGSCFTVHEHPNGPCFVCAAIAKVEGR